MRKPRLPAKPKQRACRVCACTEENACDPPCSWHDETLCSGCAEAAAGLSSWFTGAVRPNPIALAREADILSGLIVPTVPLGKKRAHVKR
ncbi:MAG TPA: hypothetical protein VK789_28105 [Bryobacteraceae bacterium]|jgi:hypothetical protein|nr:hypothetical protein [Bryobacteraceae bacterium]